MMAKFVLVFFLLATVHHLNAGPLNPSASTNCVLIKQIFQSKNMSRLLDEPVNGEKLKVCHAKETCCTQEMETHLKSVVKKDYQKMLQHHVQSVQGVIASTAIHFQDYIRQMMLEAEDKTAKLFNRLLDTASISADQSIGSFYDQLDKYLENKTDYYYLHDYSVLTTGGDSSSSSSAGKSQSTAIDRQQFNNRPSGSALHNRDDEEEEDDDDDDDDNDDEETSLETEDDEIAGNKPARLTNEFFARIFPLVYQFNLTATSKYAEFHPDYRACLRDRYDDIKPFGEKARSLTRDLAKTLEATKILIAALNFGVEVLNQSNRLITADSSPNGDVCYEALLKMSYCSKCNGHPWPAVKPCSGYCLNVMQGCLLPYSSELGAPWSAFYEAVDKLMSVVNSGQSVICLEDLLRDLHSRIGEVVTFFTSPQNQNIHNTIMYSCGKIRWMNSSAIGTVQQQSVSQTTVITGTAVVTNKVPANHPDWNIEADDLNFRSTLLSRKVKSFKDSVAKSKGFYNNLANILCSDESFTEISESACWNGQRVGEYTKLVLSSTVTSQKYNPEIPWSSTNSTDPNIMQLVEKLRRVRQIVLNQVSKKRESDPFVHMSNEEGSGNGASDITTGDDDNDDEDSNTELPDQGSGSGEVPAIVNGAIPPNNAINGFTRKLPEPPQPDNGIIATDKDDNNSATTNIDNKKSNTAIGNNNNSNNNATGSSNEYPRPMSLTMILCGVILLLQSVSNTY